MTCSMGAAFMPKDGTTFGELYKHADEALYTNTKKEFIDFLENLME